jgi:hypothetical protein
MVNWGEEEGVLPAKIWGFVDFRTKPHNDVHDRFQYARLKIVRLMI